MEIRRRPPNPIVRVENLEYVVPHREAKAKNILEEIVWHKDTEIKNFKKIISLEDLIKKLDKVSPPKDFFKSILHSKIKPGVISEHVSAFWDIFPTFCELAGTQTPEGLDGISMLPTLLDTGEQKEHEYLYWELGCNQAIRLGNWKAVRRLKGKEQKIRLFYLKTDIKERTNVAVQNPDIVKKMEEIFSKVRTEPVKYY